MAKQAPSITRVVAKREPDEAPLDDAQRRLLAEALRRAEETRDVMEDALVAFGRWVLVDVFDDDARAALEDRGANPVWRTLTARAGGPTLRLSRRLLHVALTIAARDKRIGDAAWRTLEPGRKELLLPLGDDAEMREAAQHVQAMKLSQRATRAYVGELLKGQGRARSVRLTAPRLAARLRKTREGITGAEFQRQSLRVATELTGPQRVEARRDIEALQRWATKMLDALKSAG